MSACLWGIARHSGHLHLLRRRVRRCVRSLREQCRGMIRRSSMIPLRHCAPPSKLCSPAGNRPARKAIALVRAFRAHWARRLPFKQWYSAIVMRARARVWRSVVILRPVRPEPLATGYRKPKARPSSRARTRRNRFPYWQPLLLKRMPNYWLRLISSKCTTATWSMSNLRLRAANCGSCKRAPANAQRRRQHGSPAT